MPSSTSAGTPEPGAGGFQLFNLDTMSGVYPGTRTKIFQRMRLRPVDEPQAAPQWARLLWYDSPPACVVELDARGGAEAGLPIVRLPEPLTGDLRQRLGEALAAAGWQWLACGSCALWQPPTGQTADALPAATCTYRSAGAAAAPAAQLAAQSLLALDCVHWQPASSAPAEATATAPEAVIIKPFAKRAERESDERWTWWGRLRRALTNFPPTKINLAPPAATPARPKIVPVQGDETTRGTAGRTAEGATADAGWEDKIVERSGVGAGTEPCFACQGRIANLGALAVASSEGDKQTLSIWRCRACFTYYLNDWIDRWERTDSLETEESYYRLAPEEALAVLALIDNVVHAEHPAGRFERTTQRAWVLELVAQHPRLSHQIKQGR